MKIWLLGQGFESESPDSVGHHLVKSIADRKFDRFTCIVAFSSASGVAGLEKHLLSATHLKEMTVITGVDQQGTSEEALQLLKSSGVNAYVYHHAEHTIFHPKIYLFEGKKHSRLIIGSSNLTASGLFTNVEASILVDVDNAVAEDAKVVADVRAYFKSLFDRTDPNLQAVSDILIDKLKEEQLLPTEEQRADTHEKFSSRQSEQSGKEGGKSLFPRIKALQVMRLRRKPILHT
jgi:HKD family nuclease